MTGTLTHRKGDAANPDIAGPAIIAHITNDIGAWGAGFVVALADRYPAAKDHYQRWFRLGHGTYSGSFELGAVQFVPVAENRFVANMVAQHGIRSKTNPTPIRYDALETALTKTAEFALARNATVTGPKFGAGLAGGNWNTIATLIDKTLCARGIEVVIYTQ